MIDFLVETCLLCHGLVSISDDEMAEVFKGIPGAGFVWTEEGSLHIGDLEEFMRFRALRVKGRASMKTLDDFIASGKNAALTASGTMRICREMGIRLAVSCGIGGVSNIWDREVSDDLPGLAELNIPLIATSPKDMMDIQETIKWLKDNNVKTYGVGSDKCTGYVFNSADVQLDGKFSGDIAEAGSNQLILNSIPGNERIQDLSILKKAVETGKEAASRGEHFHPAANAALDRATGGLASRIQLRSAAANARLASRLISH